MPAVLSRLVAVSLSHLVHALSSHFGLTLSSPVHTLAAGLPVPAFISHSRNPTTLLSCLVLDTTLTHFISLVLRKLKHALSDEYLRCHSTSPVEPLYLFSTLGPLPQKSERKGHLTWCL